MTTPDIPKNNPIELIKYSNNAREVLLTLAQFNELEASANSTHGMGLAQLAIHDSHATYRLFKLQLEAVVRNSQWNDVSVNGEVVASDKSSVQSELAAKALAYIHMLPDADFEEFDLRVSVYPTELDVELFGADGPIEIISVHIAPPNLAA